MSEIVIFFKEDCSQRQISKKPKISRHDIQYSLQRQFETGANVDRKSAGALKVSTEDKCFIGRKNIEGTLLQR